MNMGKPLTVKNLEEALKEMQQGEGKIGIEYRGEVIWITPSLIVYLKNKYPNQTLSEAYSTMMNIKKV